jgi:hypothetical protein
MAMEFPHCGFLICHNSFIIKLFLFFLPELLLVREMHLPYREVKVLHSWGFGGSCMSCRDTIHLICMYLEGKLSSGVQSEIERHLDSCSDCRLVLEAATTTLDRYFGPVKIPAGTQAA